MDHGKDVAVAFVRGTITRQEEFDGQYRTEIRVADDCFEVCAKGKVAERLASVASGRGVSVIGSLLHERWSTKRDGSRERLVIQVIEVVNDDPGRTS